MTKEITIQEVLELIPGYIIDIAEKLQAAGFEAYLVGGSIRDILLGIKPDDYDVATNAYPEDIEKLFKKSIPTGAKFGTITVVTEDKHGERFDVEVTTYRSDADYVGGRWPSKVTFTKTIEEDLARRDFTINAIALNLADFDEIQDSSFTIQDSKLLIDPYDGVVYLEKKLIKAVRDPIERFSEDGLRAVRGCRLASQLEFEIEEKTFAAIKETLHVTKHVSIERFRDEFLKILYRSPKPSVGLRLLKETGILELFIPELLEGIGIEQPEYHADDVFNHSLLTCDYAEDDIKVAALFHDIAKPRTMSVDEKGTHFYGHDVQGAEMTREILTRLRFPKSEIEKAATLIRWHMFYYPSADYRIDNPNFKEEVHQVAEARKQSSKLEDVDSSQPTAESRKPKALFGWSDGAVRRLIKNVGGEDQIEDLLKLRIADATANPKSDFDPKEIDALADRVADVRSKDMALKVTDLDINGHDLMNELNIEGQMIGRTLEHLLDHVIEEPLVNEKSQLLELAKGFIEGK